MLCAESFEKEQRVLLARTFLGGAHPCVPFAAVSGGRHTCTKQVIHTFVTHRWMIAWLTRVFSLPTLQRLRPNSSAEFGLPTCELGLFC